MIKNTSRSPYKKRYTKWEKYEHFKKIIKTDSKTPEEYERRISALARKLGV